MPRITALCAVALFSLTAIADTPTRQPPPKPTVEQSIDSEMLGQTVTFHVLLPPSYTEQNNRDFPVVYWLHGTNGDSKRASLLISRLLRPLMQSGQIPEAIVAFPDGMKTSMWVDSADGSVLMERYLIEEFVPAIDQRFRTIPNRDGRLIEGGSMGGYGAARLGLKHHELFGAVSMLSAGPLQPVLDPENAPIVGREHAARMINTVYGGDIDYFRAQSPWQLATEVPEASRSQLQLRLIVGAKDPVLPFNRNFSEHLTNLGIEHTLVVLPGVGHDPRSLFQALPNSEAYVSFFGLIDTGAENPDAR